MNVVEKDEVVGMICSAPDFVRKVDTQPRYKVGDTVLSANITPPGHTRLPRYARNKKGTVREYYGAQVLPDTLVQKNDEDPQHLYLVSFNAKELWGDEAGNFSVNVSLFENYIAETC
jgi:nitrile hydratase